MSPGLIIFTGFGLVTAISARVIAELAPELEPWEAWPLAVVLGIFWPATALLGITALALFTIDALIIGPVARWVIRKLMEANDATL
jgi:hypothetical protein